MSQVSKPAESVSKPVQSSPKLAQPQSLVLTVFKSGLAGASAMGFQVCSLMWMRTTMNYQFKNGGSFLPTIKILYADGGIPRFYRGIVPALIIGPISRFGDTAANTYSMQLFQRNDKLKSLPIFLQTSIGSVMAGLWRLTTLPVDAWKTSKQVNGENGLSMLIQKARTYSITAFYQGGVASALATLVGHYPWFVTNNYLEHYVPRYSYKNELLKALFRSACIGFVCTLVSDTISNSIRVIKTVKQTSAEPLTYSKAISEVVSKDGISGLMFRGLSTKLLTNGIQGVMFSVIWKLLSAKSNQNKSQK